MTRIDQFESVFKSADKTPFRYEQPEIRRVVVLCDLAAESAGQLLERVRGFLRVLSSPVPSFELIEGSRFAGIGDMLELLMESAPDLVVCYRHLNSEGWRYPYGLGEYLEVLTQATEHRVLVLPHPEAGHDLPYAGLVSYVRTWS